MATYYVRTDGSDTNAGTGSGTGSAWKTIGKALGSAGISSGDTVWIAPGTYREAVTVNMTSATVETFIKGDPTASQFSGVSAGPVIWSGFGTNDDTAPTGVPCTLNGRDYLSFSKIAFEGDDTFQGAACISAATQTSTNCKVTDCTLTGQNGSRGIRIISAASVVLNWTIERCVFIGQMDGIYILPDTSTTGADWDVNVQVINCLAISGKQLVSFGGNFGNTFKPGGVDMYNCTAIGGGGLFSATGQTSTTIPCTVTNSLCLATTYRGIDANVSGQITENYNRLIDCTNARSGVTAGANSITSGIHGIDELRTYLFGLTGKRSFSAPSVSGVIDGDGTATGAPSTDILGNTRPSPPSVGAHEITTFTVSGGLIVHPGMTGGMRG